MGILWVVLALRQLIKTHKSNLVFLLETITHHNKIEDIRRLDGYEGCFSVDRIGRSGGVAILWKNSINCSIIRYSKNHVNLEVEDDVHGK